MHLIYDALIEALQEAKLKTESDTGAALVQALPTLVAWTAVPLLLATSWTL